MKTLVAALSVATVALALGACTDVHHSSSTKTNWDGSKTIRDTTVREHPDGTVSVDETKARVR